MKSSSILFLILSAFAVYGCASDSEPNGGGNPDAIPPALVEDQEGLDAIGEGKTADPDEMAACEEKGGRLLLLESGSQCLCGDGKQAGQDGCEVPASVLDTRIYIP